MNLITRAALAALTIAAIAAVPASAQAAGAGASASAVPAAPQAAAAGEALSLQKARELVLAKSSTLRKAELAVNASALSAQSERFGLLPSVSASAGGSLGYGTDVASLSDGAAGSAKLSASETFFDGGRTQALARKGDIATDAARAALRGARVALIGDADSAFYSALSAAASVEAAASDLEAARLRLQIAQAKTETGSLSKADYLQTEAETASAETALTTAKKALASAKAKLASLTGLPASAALRQIDFAGYDPLMAKLSSLDDEAIDDLVSSIIGMARKNNPTLAGFALASGEARQAVAAARASYLPSLSAGFSQAYTRTKAAGTVSSGSVSLTATLDLDLWNTRNAVESAKVAAQQADLDGDEGLRSLELSVAQAVYEWLASARSISSSAKALEYAQSNYENVLEKFKLSSATASDLSTAEALVSGDRNSLIGARYTFLTDLSTLRGYAGLEDEAALLAPLLAAAPAAPQPASQGAAP